MAEVLVLVEHADGAVKKITAELITAARALGEPSAVVVGKSGTAAGLTDALKEAGAAKIYVAESDDADNYLITPYVDVLASLAGWLRASVRVCSSTSWRSKKAQSACTASSVARSPSRLRFPVTPQ